MSHLARALNMPASQVAPRLLGSQLMREIDGHKMVVKIVETEAYDATDAASHSYRGKTRRTEIMFGPAGFLYVYFTYGMHYCCNVVTGQSGEGSAVLIRAVEPVEGQQYMQLGRPRTGYDLTNGPAKLCQALGIDHRLNGQDLQQLPLRLQLGEQLDASAIVETTRIGISQAKDVPWRFYIKDNPWVSRLR